MLARLEAHVAEQRKVRRQRLPRAAYPAGDHPDSPRRRPQRSGPRSRRPRRPPPARQHPGDRPHRGAAAAQPRRPAVLRPRARRPVPAGGGGHRNAAAARREARPDHRDLRRHHPHDRLARAPAAADHEPRAQRDRPQPARTGHRVGHDQRSPRDGGAHRREHRREAHARNWFPHSSSRFSAAPARVHDGQPASVSAWPSSRASPRHTTETSRSAHAPMVASASSCSYLPNHGVQAGPRRVMRLGDHRLNFPTSEPVGPPLPAPPPGCATRGATPVRPARRRRR